MAVLFRIFDIGEVAPDPAAILNYLNRIDEVRGHFQGDDAGWFHADLVCRDTTLLLDRYTAEDDGIRADLNVWAAVVESRSGGVEQAQLMERIIQTRQLFTLEGPEAGLSQLLGPALCGFLMAEMDAIFLRDGEGFFAKDGTLLWRET